MPAAQPYPWAALDRLTRATVSRAREARAHFASACERRRLERAIERVLGIEARLFLQQSETRDMPRRFPLARVGLELADGGAGVVLGFEPRLATRVLAHLLERPVLPEPPELALDARLSGALAAVVVEVLRAASSPHDARVVLATADGLARPGLHLTATLLLADHPYEVAAWAWSERAPTRGGRHGARLSTLGAVELALPRVVGCCTASAAELAALRVGDGWSCGAGWGMAPDGTGHGWLCAPRSERGLSVEFTAGGQTVLRGGVVNVPTDVEGAGGEAAGSGNVGDAVLDAPLVVRVELGAISMLAREWAELKPGDVIQTGRRISEPAVLRVAGREVARGELVDVEGELAVRISELVGHGEELSR